MKNLFSSIYKTKISLFLFLSLICITTCFFVGCSKNNGPTAEQKAKVEQALSDFVKTLDNVQIDSASSYVHLKTYLKNNPFVYGAAFATGDANSSSYCTYVFNKDGKENGIVLSSYTNAEWFTGTIKEKKGYWSKPYFDDEGGKINMITFSIPVYSKDSLNKLLYVITSDLPM